MQCAFSREWQPVISANPRSSCSQPGNACSGRSAATFAFHGKNRAYRLTTLTGTSIGWANHSTIGRFAAAATCVMPVSPPRYSRHSDTIAADSRSGSRPTRFTTLPRGSVVNLVGRLPLRESAAIVSECRLYLGGDTGMTHVAAAAKRPIVEWFAHPMDVPVSVVSLYARFFPWKANVAALRPEHALPGCEQLERGFAEITGCHSREKAHCIAAIPPKQIAGAAQTMLRMK